MIDWTRIGILQRDVGPAALVPLIDLFLDEIEGEIRAAGGTHPTVRMLQRIIEAATSIGMVELARRCQTAAASLLAGRDGPPQGTIARCYTQSKKHLLTGLSGAPWQQGAKTGTA